MSSLYPVGRQHLFSLDYDEALSTFDDALRKAPNHPAPYAWKAMAVWMREMFLLGEFDMSLYLDLSRYRENEDKPQANSPVTVGLLALVEQGLARAQELSRKPEFAVEAKYYEGSLHGIRAAYNSTVLRKFWGSRGDAKKAVELQRAVLEADPGWIDANYTLGTVNYTIGRLNWFLRILAKIDGLPANRSEGLTRLERLASDGQRLRDTALITLAIAYLHEARLEHSVGILRDLAERYPRNFLFSQNLALALGYSGDWDAALVEYEILIDKVTSRVPNYHLADQHSLYLQWGQAALRARAPDVAGSAFDSVLSDDAPDRVRTLANLGRGQAADLAGNRDDALRFYRAVLAGPDVEGAHKQARSYLRAPYR